MPTRLVILNRLLKYINYLTGAAALVALVAVYWFAWRVLPQRSGSIVAGVSAPVTIARDSRGVPHIRASNEDDLFFAQGFTLAQDRLFQLELARRQAAGELSELLGPAAREADVESRSLRMRRLAEQRAAQLNTADRAPLAAFARGVNHFIETHRSALPVEFTMLSADPAPWTVADSVLIGLQMYRSMTNTYRDELVTESLLATGDRAKVEFLFPTQAAGADAMPGSNAWAISGRHTASGKPLLASDPHLALALPSVWYEVDLSAPGFHAAGMQLPGLPGVGIGHNDEIAWGITNLGFDVQDLYVEPPTTAAAVEKETVGVRGGGSRLEARIPVTRHGPVIASDGGRPLALRWMAAEPSLQWAYPFIQLNRARNWDEFRAALARHPGPGFNFVYADRAGNIGLQVAGQLPIRPAGSGAVPAAQGTGEWTGVIAFDALPSIYNPPSGRVITANQNPFPANFAHPVRGNFAAPYRARQIEAMLARGKAWRPDGMLRIQTDVYSAFSHFLARQLAAAYRARRADNPSLADAVALLEKWDGQMTAASPEAFLVTLAFQHLRKTVAERAAPGKAALYEAQAAPVVLEQLLRQRPADWFPDYDQVLLRVLSDAVEEGRRVQGNTISKWSYGRYLSLTLETPALGQLPWIGSWFRLGPVRLSGSATTVRQTTRRLGPSMRFVADLSDWDRSLIVNTAGQSGQVLSSNRIDQWETYWAGKAFPMQFARVEPATTLTLVPEFETRAK